MLILLRQIRRKLLTNNKVTTYLLYAIGEIILVVVGILIAVSIDNWNEDRTNRARELQYLKNIKTDLLKDLASLEEMTAYRKEKIVATSFILQTINKGVNEDLDSLIWAVGYSMAERKFRPNNTTFSELSNSGNLSLISSDSIKTLLLNLTKNYARNIELIEHETYDYREYISQPIASSFDLNKYFPIRFEGKTASALGVKKEEFNSLLQDLQYKNGIHIIQSMSEAFIPEYHEMMDRSGRIIQLIDIELQK